MVQDVRGEVKQEQSSSVEVYFIGSMVVDFFDWVPVFNYLFLDKQSRYESCNFKRICTEKFPCNPYIRLCDWSGENHNFKGKCSYFCYWLGN